MARQNGMISFMLKEIVYGHNTEFCILNFIGTTIDYWIIICLMARQNGMIIDDNYLVYWHNN